MDLFVTRATDLAHAVETADSSRSFRSAVDDFEQLLSRVSDYPPDFLTDSEGKALSSIADTVVERIERRLDAHADRAAVQRELGERIYMVRLDVEHIYTVLRHGAESTRTMGAGK
jgi:hypothetical protein